MCDQSSSPGFMLPCIFAVTRVARFGTAHVVVNLQRRLSADNVDPHGRDQTGKYSNQTHEWPLMAA